MRCRTHPTLALLLMHDGLGKLAEVHGKNVGHADLKPENIMVHEDGHFHLVDTDNASVFAAHGMDDIGDFNRMPPEQQNSGRFSAASDMWSFGLVLWEFVSGDANPVRGKGEAYGQWHHALPRQDGRVDVTRLPGDAFGASLGKLPVWLRDAVVNDLVQPNDAQRAPAAVLLRQLPAVPPEVLAMSAQLAHALPTYLRGVGLDRATGSGLRASGGPKFWPSW